jgi:hypothetical protein
MVSNFLGKTRFQFANYKVWQGVELKSHHNFMVASGDIKILRYLE